ncbi:MAG: glycine zipper 2TM domain-containing protein [Pseudomonadota bacterium]
MPTTRFIIRALLIAATVVSMPAAVLANPVFYEFAPVVNIEPIVVTESVPVQREVCWYERDYDTVHYAPDPATSTIAGAIIGGVIGNQFGGGNGKRALTVAGAALGASVGNSASRQRGVAATRPVQVERCQWETTMETQNHHQGFRVQYEFGGRVYETRMPEPPGETIRLEVRARPIQ